MSNYSHIPVMLKEALDFLDIKVSGNYIDGTLGGGGYSKIISEKIGPQGNLISIDLDPLAIDNFLKSDYKNVIVVNDNFANLEKIVLENKKGIKFDGIVVDLGLSSAQLEDDSRGFSFLNNGDLDMSFGPQALLDTSFIVNSYNIKDLERVIKEYGQEPWARRIAHNIVFHRRKKKIKTTQDLVDIVKASIPRKFWPRKIHLATKTFQALRMETNKELESLEEFLPVAIKLLKKGGRLVVVSFHSLEDRIVKNFFKDLAKKEKPVLKILTTKPLTPSAEEIVNNHRSRSAKLRAIEKL
jgi:16S rRNA (cytosine1402-N4)-methyltransferase